LIDSQLNTTREGDADEMSMLYWGDEVEESEHSRRAAALRQVRLMDAIIDAID